VPDVYLDGEKVDFSGPPPASISEVRAALEQVLATDGRVLAGMTVGGQPFDESTGDRPAEGVRIEACSLALAEALTQVASALAPELIVLRDSIHAFAHQVLRAPWPEMQDRGVQLVETTAGLLQRAVEVAALSGEESPAARAVAALASTVEAWMSALQQRDAAEVALQLADEVAPSLANLAGVLQGKAAP
jgi:hypothetical protein